MSECLSIRTTAEKKMQMRQQMERQTDRQTNWILTSRLPQRVTSGRSDPVISKCTFQISSHKRVGAGRWERERESFLFTKVIDKHVCFFTSSPRPNKELL